MEVMVAYHLKQESVVSSPAKLQIPSILIIGHVGLMGMLFLITMVESHIAFP